MSYLSLFYTRFEFARRLGFFYGQSAVAGAVGGLLSYWVILKFPPESAGDSDSFTSGWKAWQILFLIEGGLTICIALAGFFWLPHGPSSAWFLSESERAWAQERVVRDRGGKMAAVETKQASDVERACEESPAAPQHAHTEEQTSLLLTRSPSRIPSDMTSDSGLTRRDVVSAILEWKIWYLLIVNMLSAMPASAFSVFLPLVMRGVGGASPSRANLLTAPAFATGVLVLFLFTYWSDARRTRLLPILAGLAVLLLGLCGVVALPRGATGARYVALCVMLGGTYVASPLTVAWLAGNVEAPSKRAVVLGINGWGNLAGVFSSLLFRPRFAPDYLVPFYVTLACVSVSLLGFAALRLMLAQENATRRAVLACWSKEDVERERVSGRGPLEEARTLAHGIMALVGIGDEGRQGEDRMTFVYGL